MGNQENNEQYIIGMNAVVEAIQSGREINKVFIAEGMQHNKIQKLLSLLKERKIITKFVPRKKIDSMLLSRDSQGVNQGVIAEIAAYDYTDFQELLKQVSKKNNNPLIILLDKIEDPHNLGSILRTADVVGADGVIIPERRSVSLTATVAKTSSGAIEYVPVTRVTNLGQTIEKLKKAGFWIIGTDASGEKLFNEVDYRMPTCLIVGSEGKGMSRLIKEKCDMIVRLPMKGHINSLNASVATSIILYEIFRQNGY